MTEGSDKVTGMKLLSEMTKTERQDFATDLAIVFSSENMVGHQAKNGVHSTFCGIWLNVIT
jgi:hypothetical protein